MIATTQIDEITATALDYAESAYEGDGARMERALHPHLAKRMVYTDASGKSHLSQMSALELVRYARDGAGIQPEDHRQRDIRVLDVYGNAATVRLEMNDWIDYLHMAKYEGQWLIINVLWELKSKE